MIRYRINANPAGASRDHATLLRLYIRTLAALDHKTRQKARQRLDSALVRSIARSDPKFGAAFRHIVQGGKP